jgi:UDP-hydrolysing UDP-N-acetyl-D-glucosamine 2-epimerase
MTRLMNRKIAVVTSSRADYSHLYWVLVELAKRPKIELSLITMGPHLSSEFGNTSEDIIRDGFAPAANIECLLSSDSDVGMAKTIGVATLGLADTLGKLRPDLLLLIADRYEMLAPASVALSLRIPVAHIEGGDVSLGAIDEAVRNALTKLSHIHLTTTQSARRRVISMGEEPWRVHVVGSPSLDHLTKGTLLSRDEVQRQLNFALGESTVAVIYHPVTLARDTLCEADELFAALEGLSHNILFISPNADAGSRELLQRVMAFAAQRANARVVTSIDHRTYLSLMQFLTLLSGNSSSGIMEAASFRLPVVNIGIRQKGREHGGNVVPCGPQRDEIASAMRLALSHSFKSSLHDLKNPYGDGHASEKIVDVLSTLDLSETLLAKQPAPILEEAIS